MTINSDDSSAPASTPTRHRTRAERLKGLAVRSVSFHPVWKAVSPEIARELADFWLANRALEDRQEAAERAVHAVCLMRDEHGKLCGVTTARLAIWPLLGQPMYYLMGFVSKHARGDEVPFPLFFQSKQVLEDYNRSLAEPESLGLLLELHSVFLAERYRLAHTPEFDVTFIGYRAGDLQMRVSYFKDAVLKPWMGR